MTGRPRRSPAVIALAVLATVAVIALAVVAIVAVSGDDGTATHMTGTEAGRNGMPMGSNSMNGSMDDSMMGHDASSPTVPGAREIAVTASSFKFQPAEIHVRAGEDVTIVLTSTDVGHDFTIDGLDVHVAAEPGRPERGGLHAPSIAGRYTAYCSVAGHRQAGMIATVVVGES